ncbi:MAG: hypothetical protein JJU00_10395 [Opitutales bacterium]|nr:hypothetical protein [Opitutales bacterium]
MRQLVTLTGNILAEFTAEYADDTRGKTHRARADSFQTGGKGINVARMAQRLGLPATAVYIAGGPVGGLCEAWLRGQPFRSRRVDAPADARAGWVVRTPGGAETTYLGADRPVDPPVWRKAVEAARPGEDTAAALCGSVPGWTAEHTAAVSEIWFPDGTPDGTPAGPAYLDTYGKPLAELAVLPWTAVKINLDEFERLEGADPADGTMEARLRRIAATSAAQTWIVTDGGNPVSVLSRDEGYFQRQPPDIQLVSPTGSGDVFLATLIAERARGASLRKACAEALRLSAANAAHPGVAEFPLGG